MALCEIPGRPDLYGLGIRVAFYIQWTGAVVVSFVDESEIADIRFIGVLLSAAVTLSIIICASSSPPFSTSNVSSTNDYDTNGNPPLQPADVYISLLLAAGMYLFLVPPYVFRAFTLCNPYWNPFQRRGEPPALGTVFRWCNFLLLLAVSSVGVWFYTTFLPQWWGRAGGDGCDQYGFFFSSISLDNRAYVAFNALLYILILVVCAGIILANSGCCSMIYTEKRKRRKVRTSHLALLRTLLTISNVVVLAVLIAAVELSIQFNDIPAHVNDLSTSAQVIPLVLSAGFVVRIAYRWISKRAAGDSSSSDDGYGDYYDHSSYYSGQPPTGGPTPPPAAYTG